MSYLQYSFADLYNRILNKLGDPTLASNITQAKQIVNDAYFQWWGDGDWACKDQTGTITFNPAYLTISGDASVAATDYASQAPLTAAWISASLGAAWGKAADINTYFSVSLTGHAYFVTDNGATNVYGSNAMIGTYAKIVGSGAATITVASAAAGVDLLPAYFESMTENPVLVTPIDGYLNRKLQERPVWWIEQYVAQMTTWTWIPEYYAIRPVTPMVQSIGTQWQILTWPKTDLARTATVQYRARPLQMVNDTDFPLGGSLHGRTTLDAALMIWERDVSNTSGQLRENYYGSPQKHIEGSLDRAKRLDYANRAAIVGTTPRLGGDSADWPWQSYAANKSNSF